MAETMATLRTLDRMLDQADELRSRLVRGPRVLTAAETDLTAVRKVQAEQEDHLRRTQRASTDKAGTLKQRESRLAELQVKLNMATKTVEYQAIKDQIAADRAASDVLSDEILELLERADEISGTIGQTQERLSGLEADRKRLSDHLDSERATLESELARIEGQISAIMADVPADVRSLLTSKIRTNQPDILAPLSGGGCGNCHSSVTPNRISKLKMGTPIICESCGAVVYIPPDNRE